MSTYPHFETIITGKNKDCLLSIKRSIRSILPVVFWFILTTYFVYLLTLLATDPDYSEYFSFISPRIFAIVPLCFLLEIIRRRFDDLYLFSDQHIKQFRGRISLSYSIPTLSYVDIRSLQVKQSIWGRILDYGDVLLGTSASSGEEMVISGVLSPNEVMEIIESFREISDANQRSINN